MKEVQKYLGKFAKDVIEDSRTQLNNSSRRDTNNLYNSLDFELDVHKNSFSLSFLMEQYGAFVDRGVKGKSSSAKAPDSPFQFGTGSATGGRPLRDIMADYAKRKGFQWNDKKTGRFMSHKSMGFLMAKSIYHKGIAPSLFFTKPFEAAFKDLPDELVEKFGLGVEELIKHTLKTK
jgi:hypothetical protein